MLPVKFKIHRSDKKPTAIVRVNGHEWKLKQEKTDFWAIRLNIQPSIFCSSKTLDRLMRKIFKLEYVWGEKTKAIFTSDSWKRARTGGSIEPGK